MRLCPNRASLWRSTPLFCLALMTGAHAAAAQDDPRLVGALQIAQEGRSDSARTIVNGLIRGMDPADTLYPQALYTLGLVSGSVNEMRRVYTRVAVEYANSGWADDALFRLALLDYASGNHAEATRQFEKIRNDYPESSMLGPAAEWAARSFFDQKKPRDACQWVAIGLERAGEDVELKNRLEFLNGRCATLPADTTAVVPVTPPAESTRVAAAPVRSGYAVQVGAVGSQATADGLVADIQKLGMKGYVVKAGSLFKVRAGPWPDRAAAQGAIAKLKARFGGAPFVVQES